MEGFREALTRLAMGERIPALFTHAYDSCFALCCDSREAELVECITQVARSIWVTELERLKARHESVVAFLSRVRLIPAGGALVQHVLLTFVKKTQDEEETELLEEIQHRKRAVCRACQYLDRFYLPNQFNLRGRRGYATVEQAIEQQLFTLAPARHT